MEWITGNIIGVVALAVLGGDIFDQSRPCVEASFIAGQDGGHVRTA